MLRVKERVHLIGVDEDANRLLLEPNHSPDE
jgi:hypothetical protein